MKIILPLALTILYCPSAFSWGKLGHQTVGEIAERFLNHEARQGILNILGPEKLALSANWADEIRDDSDFGAFDAYHFISLDDLPYESTPITEHNPKDAMTILQQVPAILKNSKIDRNVKMVALKFLIHVVGDVHQPLHVGKKSDAGGNFCKVMWDKQALSLHQVWDGKIIEYDVSRLKLSHSPLRFYTYQNYADDILKNNPLSEEQKRALIDSSPYAWIRESQIARVRAYPTNAPPSFCQKNSNEWLHITEDYKKSSVLLSEERILYAGLRLSHLLNSIFIKGNNSTSSGELSKKQIIDQLNLTNY